MYEVFDLMKEDQKDMNAAIVLSGGMGTRLNASIPKQYIKVQNKMLITYALETLAMHPQIDLIIIVAEEKWQSAILMEIGKVSSYEWKIKAFAEPGITRQYSIYNGLEVIDTYWHGQITNVLIHDAARPNLTMDLISDCLNALTRYDGVMPVLPMKDTIYVSRDKNTITNLLDREMLFAGQAPEAFCFDAYLSANKRLLPNRLHFIKGSTEPAILAGMDVVMIAGDEQNYKITTSSDLERFRNHLINES